MKFCPECGCKLDYSKVVVLCTQCTFSECNCELCSSQDVAVDVQTSVEQKYTEYIELEGGANHVEQAD
jgi:hypothetical protein